MSQVPPFDHEQGPDGPERSDELLAGEFVLGLLNPDEHKSASQRRATDAKFAGHVERWEERLAPWLAEFRPVAAPSHLWPQLKRRLGWSDTRPGWLQSLGFWRGVAALAVVVTVALLVSRPPRVPAPTSPPREEAALTRPVTTLAQDDGRAGWLATVDRERGTVLMVPVPRAPDAAGRVPELWIIAPGQAPRSLGAVSINRAHTVGVPADARWALAAPGAVLAITLEPSPGIPHGAPTGPIIAKGAIQT
jgi:anti-sigma-K factor RskA